MIPILLASIGLSGQGLKGVKWDSLPDLMQKEQRPLAIFIHTSWCKYCKHMEASTLADEDVKQTLTNQFYFVRLDAETDSSIFFMGQVFPPDPRSTSSGTHTLAKALSDPDRGVVFPTFILMNPAQEITFRHEGYLGQEDLKRVLVKTLAHPVEE